MNPNVQGGLVLIGVSAALLYAWWSGALDYFLEQLTGRALAGSAGAAGGGQLGAAPSSGGGFSGGSGSGGSGGSGAF